MNYSGLTDALTADARAAHRVACEWARERGDACAGTEHLLWGLFSLRAVREAIGPRVDMILEELLRLLPAPSERVAKQQWRYLTGRARSAVALAIKGSPDGKVTPPQLVLALLSVRDGLARQAVVNVEGAFEHVVNRMKELEGKMGDQQEKGTESPAIEAAWGVIANAADWEWREAAKRWREAYVSNFDFSPHAEVIEAPEKKEEIRMAAPGEAAYHSFEDELMALLNRRSMENPSGTPDHLLAQYLVGCLKAFDSAVRMRSRWYGRASEELVDPGHPDD